MGMEKKIGPLVAGNGSDYSVYYKALNNTLNNDSAVSLGPAIPLVQRMTYLLLHDEPGKKHFHPGGTVWKGDSLRPSPIHMQKLREAEDDQTVIRFRQFQSTT